MNYLAPKSLTVGNFITAILRVKAARSSVVCLPTPEAPTNKRWGLTIPDKAFSAEAILTTAWSKVTKANYLYYL